MTIKFKKLREDAVLPKYAHGSNEDAGMDLVACEDVLLLAGIPQLVPCGFAMELPPGFEGQIRPRSGLALKNAISVTNAPGTIDPSYRGEIKVNLIWGGLKPNSTDVKAINGQLVRLPAYEVKKGDRIAQLVVARYEPIEWEEAELSESERGEGGFGSTGT